MSHFQQLDWVQKILQPYIDGAPPGVIPILFLDSYCCHMMESVVVRIQELGVEQVEHIPGGCTYLCQPVDVGVNKPFKARIRQEWENHMVAQGLNYEATPSPKRIDIVNWAIKGLENLSEEIICNAWRSSEYTWFPAACTEAPTTNTDGVALPDSSSDDSGDEILFPPAEPLVVNTRGSCCR